MSFLATLCSFIDILYLFDIRTRKIFGVLNEIQGIFDYHLFQREEEIYDVRVESIDNDDEMVTHIYIYFEPAHRTHIVISHDQLGMFDANFDNSLVLTHWSRGKVVHQQSRRHVSNDRNFAFLLHTCGYWVMIRNRWQKELAQDQKMKALRRQLVEYYKKWI